MSQVTEDRVTTHKVTLVHCDGIGCNASYEPSSVHEKGWINQTTSSLYGPDTHLDFCSVECQLSRLVSDAMNTFALTAPIPLRNGSHMHVRASGVETHISCSEIYNASHGKITGPKFNTFNLDSTSTIRTVS